MFKNPINNGNLSDNSSLKNIIDNSKIVKKYSSRKLKQGIPNEMQKYNEFLTYQKPILDEANYLAERIKNENIQKQKDNFEFIEKIKNEREIKMKELANKQSDKEIIKKELFDDIPKQQDLTPTIYTDLEFEIRDINNNNQIENESILSKVDTEINNNIKKIERKGRPKGSKNISKGKTLYLGPPKEDKNIPSEGSLYLEI